MKESKFKMDFLQAKIVVMLNQMPVKNANQTWIAGKLRLSRAWVGEKIQDLVTQGAVVINKAPHDKRLNFYTLSKKYKSEVLEVAENTVNSPFIEDEL